MRGLPIRFVSGCSRDVCTGRERGPPVRSGFRCWVVGLGHLGQGFLAFYERIFRIGSNFLKGFDGMGQLGYGTVGVQI